MESTGEPAADRIIQQVVDGFSTAFRGRVRAYYLRGSYATGSHTAGSDLDLFVVFAGRFRDRAEAERAHRLAGRLARGSPLLLELLLVSEHQLQQPENLIVALNLRRDTRLLLGRDIRPDLPPLEPGAYLRAAIGAPLTTYRYPPPRHDHPYLTYPLRHLDPDGEFFGYDCWQVPGADRIPQPSTKLLVGSVGWTATAVVVLRSGGYVRDKQASVARYREQVTDQWTDLVVDVHELCRDRWHYRIPAADRDRRTLRGLCDRALGFQNHFLGRYRDFQLAELRSGVADRQTLAVRRLAQVRFPDREVAEALGQAS